jgi:hypothetical protein
MRSPRTKWIAIPAMLAHGAANADSDALAAAGLPILAMIGTVFYVSMCLLSIPLSLFLRGSIFKRIALGLVAPLVGMVLAWLTVAWLQHLRYIDMDETNFVFTVVAAIPLVGLLIWGIASRERAAAFERSRVYYAEYLEREKSLAKLDDANSRRAK